MQTEVLKPSIWRPVPRSLRRLSKGLDAQFEKAHKALGKKLRRKSEDEGLSQALLRLSQIRDEVRSLASENPGAGQAIGRLSTLADSVSGELKGKPAAAGEVSARIVCLLLAACQRLGDQGVYRKSETDQPLPGRPVCVIAAELLFQARLSLFPPEKMLVGSGRREDANLRLSALYDVTGPASMGHVRADDGRLAQALIAMERSGSFLLGWLHSHPGRGHGATRPSSTDLRQQADWLRDFSPQLISLIFTGDGLIRFWGAALEKGRVSIRIEGKGIEQTKEPYVYRFTS